MSKHSNWIHRIEHILNAVRQIQKFTNGLDCSDFEEDEKTFRAVERCFEIIGEAVKHVPENIKKEYAHIEWRKMQDMRNVISHNYEDIIEETLWNTIQDNLPALKEQLEKLIEAEENDKA